MIWTAHARCCLLPDEMDKPEFDIETSHAAGRGP